MLRRLKLLCVCQGGLYHGDADFHEHEHEHEHGCGVERAISIKSVIQTYDFQHFRLGAVASPRDCTVVSLAASFT